MNELTNSQANGNHPMPVMELRKKSFQKYAELCVSSPARINRRYPLLLCLRAYSTITQLSMGSLEPLKAIKDSQEDILRVVILLSRIKKDSKSSKKWREMK
jgi:hypothetical protein